MLNMKNTILSANVLHSPAKLLTEIKTLQLATLAVVSITFILLTSLVITHNFNFKFNFGVKGQGLELQDRQVVQEGDGLLAPGPQNP